MRLSPSVRKHPWHNQHECRLADLHAADLVRFGRLPRQDRHWRIQRRKVSSMTARHQFSAGISSTDGTQSPQTASISA